MAATISHKLTEALPEFVQENDLCSDKVGGKILFATDDYFGGAENLLKPSAPVWNDEYTEFGKWMDGWETRRKRIPGHDWCIIQLGVAGRISGIDIDTSFFTGNYAPKASIQAADLNDDVYPARDKEIGTTASENDFRNINHMVNSEKWEEILPKYPLLPGYENTCHNYFAVESTRRWSHLRLNIYPDGGIARLRVYGQAFRNWSLVSTKKVMDLVALENGGICLDQSDAHFGHPRNIICPGRSMAMADGWETARRPDRPDVLVADDSGTLKFSGSEWAEFQLGHVGVIHKIEVSTHHFKGNYPETCSVDACQIDEEGTKKWQPLLTPKKLLAHSRHFYEFSQLIVIGAVSHVRLTITPDGGISRFRCWGYKKKTDHRSSSTVDS